MAPFQSCRGREVCLKGRNNRSGRIPINKGHLQAMNGFGGVSHSPLSSDRANQQGFRLSAEERRIIALVVCGQTNKDIARRFSLSESTIKRRMGRILGNPASRTGLNLHSSRLPMGL